MIDINPFSALSPAGQANADRKAIADNFDTFLTLLTTQLRNQSPLDPLNTNEFTQQLVQFTEVEQSVKMNANLERLAALSAATTITGAVGYIGKQVTASGARAELSQNPASWQFSVPEASSAATFTIRDANGTIVSTETRPVPAGESLYVWNGQTNEGGLAPHGTYTLSVRAEAGSGQQLQVSLGLSGLVEAVDMSGSEPVLIVGGRTVRLDEVTAIRTAGG